MKKKILYGIVAMMTIALGSVKAYEGLTQNNMSALMMENIEALTNGEDGTNAGSCARRSGPNGQLDNRMFCDSRTSYDKIYPCPTSSSIDYYVVNNMDRCTK